jgi:hypothetical protein
MNAAIPWYKSPQTLGLITTAVSAIVAAFPKIGQILGWSSPSDVSAAVSAAFGFVAIIAPIIGTIVRAKSTVQPLTLTQKGADVHPATVAANQPMSSWQTPGGSK